MTRPPEFDARVAEHIPLLRKMVRRYERNEQDREDAVQDTVVGALRRWKSYQYEGSFGSWLVFQMRSEIAARRRKKRPDGAPIDDYDNISVPAVQESAAGARIALSALRDTRGERMLVRLANGETLADIGSTAGLSRERVRVITDRARRDYGKRLRRKVDAKGMAV